MKKLIAAASLLVAFSAQAATQEAILDQIEANPAVPVKQEGTQFAAKKTESRSVQGWYFE